MSMAGGGGEGGGVTVCSRNFQFESGVFFGLSNRACCDSFGRVSCHVLLLSPGCLGDGIPQRWESPTILTSPPHSPPPPKYTQTMRPAFCRITRRCVSRIGVSMEECPSRRTGASHLFCLQCVRELFIPYPFPSLRTPAAQVSGHFQP